MNLNSFQWRSPKSGAAVARPSEPAVLPSRFTTRLVAGVLTLNLMVLMLVALTLYESRKQHEKQAVVTAQNLSHLLEHDLAASFDKIDLPLLTVVDEVSRLRGSGSLDASALNAFITRQATRLPELTDLRMADAQGNLRYGTGLRPDTHINIADRQHFIRQRDRPDAGLVIGMPTVSRMNGKWQIVMSRRLNQSDGSFAGTVGAVIELKKITAKFSSLDIGRRGIINLYDHELAMISRYPVLENAKPPIGQKIISRQFEEQLRRTSDAGVFHATSPLDRLERTFSYRKVTSYPFYIVVGLATDDYLGEWWKDVVKNGILMAVFALVTLGFGWLTVGAWKRREAALEVVQQQKQKFRTLLESSPDPLVIADAQGLIQMVNRQLVALFGFESEELLGQPVEVLLPQRYHGGHVALRQGYTAAPQVSEMGKDRLLWAITKQGGEIPVNVNLSPIQTEQGLMVAAAIRDISERRAIDAKIKRLTDLYAALNQCRQAIVRCASEDELFLQICRAAVEFGGMKMAWIGLLDEAKQLVKPVAWYGANTDYLEGIQISVKADEPAGRGGGGTAIRENRPVWIQDFQTDPRLAPWRERGARAGWRATAALPLLRQGKVIGVFSLNAGELNAFDEVARNLLVEMARDIGQVLDNHSLQAERKQMEEQVRQLAFYDTLTKLPNRRLLNDRLSQAMAASKRSACYGALMFLDLDNFKPLNDLHGHGVGDLLLIEVADRLKSCVREIDTVARFGGDEFVVMLSELNADKAESMSQAGGVAEKIRIALSEPYRLSLRHEGKADTSVEHRCTASIGVALFIHHEASQDDILKRADTAMYQAKEAGRNLIRFYDSKAGTTA